MDERFAEECHTEEGRPLLTSIKETERELADVSAVPAGVRELLDRLRREIEVRDRELRARADQLCRTMVENAVVVARTALQQAQNKASAEDRIKFDKKNIATSGEPEYWRKRLEQDVAEAGQRAGRS